MDHVHRFDTRPARLTAGALAALALALTLAGCSKSTTAPATPLVEAPLSALNITLAADTLQVGTTRQFVTQAYDTLGALLSYQLVHWSSSNPSVVTVNANGLANAIGEGSAVVRALSGGKRDSAFVFVYPDTGWFVQPSNASGANLFGVTFRPDGRNGWAVGAGGKIVHTSDAGLNWATQASSTGFTLNGVWFTSDLDGWACGANGTVMHTVDGGGSWSRLSNVGSSAVLKDIMFVDANHGWACGSNGTVVSTIDGGANWNLVILPTSFTLNGLSFYGTLDGWAVGDNGTLFGTHDGGASWYPLSLSTGLNLRSVWRLDNALAVAVGQGGLLAGTYAGPDSVVWASGNVGASNDMYGVFQVNVSRAFAVGANGVGLVLRTDDGGATWQPQVSHSTQRLNDVYFVDSLRGWAVGNGGTIVHTATGGFRP